MEEIAREFSQLLNLRLVVFNKAKDQICQSLTFDEMYEMSEADEDGFYNKKGQFRLFNNSQINKLSE